MAFGRFTDYALQKPFESSQRHIFSVFPRSLLLADLDAILFQTNFVVGGNAVVQEARIARMVAEYFARV